MTTAGVRGAITSPTSTSFSVTTPATGERSVASASVFSSGRDLRGRGGDARARGVDLLAAARRRAAAPWPARRARTRLSAAWHTLARHVAPRRRIVSLLARAGVGLEQRLEALEVLLGGLELGSRGRHVGARGLRPAPRAWRMSSTREPACSSAQLRFGLAAVRLGALDGQLDVARVERGGSARPASTRSPSFTASVRMRPPTSGASRTSVASTWPDARISFDGASFVQAQAATASVKTTSTVHGHSTSFWSIRCATSCM